MPLPTPPSKLGSLLPPDEFKAKARPARGAKKQGTIGEQTEAAEYGATSHVAAPMGTAANAGAALRPLPSPPPAPEAAPAARRKSKQTAALLQPAPTPAPAPAFAPLHARSEGSTAATPRVPASAPRSAAKTRKSAVADTELRKLFVLDTNVLMHDPTSLFRFEEHDVYLPMMTLEELDNHKKGMSEVARNARQVSRTLDSLVANAGQISDGLPLAGLGSREALGRLYFQTKLAAIEPVEGLPQGKADNQILGVVRALQRDREDRQVVLVSKDINMRIKAHALGLPAEDYFNDQVLEDSDLLFSGVRPLPQDFWTKHAKGMESWQDNKTGTTYYRVTGPLCPSLLVNEFVYLEPQTGEPPFQAIVRELNGKTAVLQTLRDYSHHKNNV
ncbi:MAG: PIN domain-containing protein, partial [Trinickia sp.]